MEKEEQSSQSLPRRRLLLRNFVSPDLCKELQFIHRSCSTVGYRPNVLSTTLSHLVATNCAHLILPFLSLRDRVKDEVERFFRCEFDLFLEFTALISWCKGACIGWHSDDNRPYLKQRHFSAVCYLNSHDIDFRGGVFRFQDGEPSVIAPVAGDVLIYTADDHNIHSVDEVTKGERLTLTLWFTRDNKHDEDAKLIPMLSQRLHEKDNLMYYHPLVASDNMYWFHHDKSGFDIRHARVRNLGYNFLVEKSADPSNDPLELLSQPLHIGRGDGVFEKEFLNSLHALQILQFCHWKAAEIATRKQAVGLNESFRSFVPDESMKLVPCNFQYSEEIFGGISSDNTLCSFDHEELTLGTVMWEDYISGLHKYLLILLPYWSSHNSLFFVTPPELENCCS